MIRTVFGFGFLFLLLGMVSTVYAQQAETVIETNPISLKLERMDVLSTQRIPFLKWSSDRFHYIPSDEKVMVSGSLLEPVKEFQINGMVLQLDSNQAFEFEIPIKGNRVVQVEVADQKGNLLREQYRLVTETDSGLVVTQISGTDESVFSFSKFRFSVGTGVTLISYRQQDTTTFEERALTVKGGVVYRAIESKLDLGVSAFYNAAILSNTSSVDQVKYFGANLRATYHVIDEPSLVRFNISTGLYWNSSSGNVGFADMIGPQIYPDVTFVLPRGHSLMLYGKFAASLHRWQGLDFHDNREVAFGTHYSFPVSNLNRLSIGVDASQLSLSATDAWASTNTYSFSLGMSF